MSERKWPNFYSLFIRDNFELITDFEKRVQKWFEVNLTEAELDRIAPKKCEHGNVISHHGNPMNLSYVRYYACHQCGMRLKPLGWEEVDGK